MDRLRTKAASGRLALRGTGKRWRWGAEVWVEMVKEDGRRFMAAWRKQEMGAARYRQERERQRDWKSCYHTQKQRRILQSDTPIRRVEVILYGRETDQDLRSA